MDWKLSGSLLPGWHYITIWMKFMVSRSTRPALVEVLKRPLAGRTEMKFLGRRNLNTLYRWPRKTTCPMPPREWGFRVGTGCLLVRQKNILTWASQVLLWGCLAQIAHKLVGNGSCVIFTGSSGTYPILVVVVLMLINLMWSWFMIKVNRWEHIYFQFLRDILPSLLNYMFETASQ